MTMNFGAWEYMGKKYTWQNPRGTNLCKTVNSCGGKTPPQSQSIEDLLMHPFERINRIVQLGLHGAVWNHLTLRTHTSL